MTAAVRAGHAPASHAQPPDCLRWRAEARPGVPSSSSVVLFLSISRSRRRRSVSTRTASARAQPALISAISSCGSCSSSDVLSLLFSPRRDSEPSSAATSTLSSQSSAIESACSASRPCIVSFSCSTRHRRAALR